MKILLTTAGGVVRGIESWPEYGIARELVKKGHEVTVYSSISVKKVFKNAKKKENIDGIDVERFNPVSPASFFKTVRNDFDVIHMHHLGYLSPISSYACLASKIKKTPTVFTVHGIYHDPFVVKDTQDPFSQKINYNVTKSLRSRPWRFPNWFVHLPLFSSNRITALTEWEKKELSKFDVDGRKIDVVPNGIYTKKIQKVRNGKAFREKHNLDGPFVLFLGQPIRRKGPEYLIKALPSILKKIPDLTCVFAGYKSDKHLEDLCKRLGLENNIKFLGFLEEEEKIQAMKAAETFVFPTLYEGFGIPLIEAMAAGCPIVTTNVAGVPEIVENNKNGLLTRPKDEKDLARNIIKMLSSSKMRKKMSANNVKKSKKYDWKNVISLYEKCFERAISQP
ncbi:MAG: glycosyltransferase family 4 protein [Candidatus Aenigmarchaeota archaeon]|nr:glycosyltransferase family 4 protein [Candidatus Aenigmarchaeota archaeon]